MSRTSPTSLAVTLLGVLVLGSLLALGAVHAGSLYLVAAIASLAAALTLRSHPMGVAGRAILLPYGVLLGLAVYSAVQGLPLPLAFVAALSPAKGDIWERSLSPIGEVPRWASLSLDPGASLLEALKWLSYANVFLVAARLGRMRGAFPGTLIVFGSAILAALLTLAHGLTGASSVYGFYEPRLQAVPWHLGPLLNPNNLAGYLNLGTFCGLGLLLEREGETRTPPWLVAIGIALTLGIGITTGSRAGLLSLVVGLLAFAILAGRMRRARGRMLRALAFGLAICGGLALAFLGATSDTWRELLSKDLKKLEMSRWILPVLADHGWLGIGRGAFESVFPAYRPSGGNIVFTHVESFPAQWIVEWGAPLGFAALLALGWAFWPRKLPKRPSSPALGIGIGLGVLFLQNLADLALEVPAVAIAVVTLLGTLAGRGHDGQRATPIPGFLKEGGRVWQAATCLVPAVLVGTLLVSGWRHIEADRAHIQKLVEARDPEGLAVAREAIVASMRRHPADPYLPLQGAIVARKEGRDPLPWLSRSLERALINPRAHLLLADVLHSLGATEQALLELRIALEQEPTLSAPVATMAIRMTRDFERLVSVAGEGTSGAHVLEDMALRLAPEEGELRLRLHREAMQRDASRPGPRIALAEARIREHRSSASPDEHADFAKEIEAHAQATERARTGASDALRLRAGSLVARGRAEEASRLLAEGCARVSDELRCLRARVDAAAASQDPELLPAALKALLARACVTIPDCAEAATHAGRIATARGDRGAALGYFLRAAREDPTEARWREVARAAAAVGAHSQAADALERIARMRGGADTELRKEIDEARMRALAR